jgi:AcrR family transcriptional regulator
VRRTQRERSAATVANLVVVARELFARQGYAATSLDMVATAAGVTKGGLYHHFASKQVLFREVYEREQHTIMDAIAAAYTRERDAWSGFRAGVKASLTISCRPDVQRITLVDAPGAIGWEAMREIENRSTMRMLERGLSQLMNEGWIEARPVGSLASFLFGGMCEMAMSIAHSSHQRKDKAAAFAEIDRILDAFRHRTPTAGDASTNGASQ